MGTMDGMIAPGYTALLLDRGEASIARRNKLKNYAQVLSKQSKQSQITDLDAFVSIASFASLQFSISSPSLQDVVCKAYLEDLRRVLIGDGFTNTERNTGTYALGFNAFHDSGFKPEFKDGGNQVQHAMAGIYISAVYGFPVTSFTYWQEDEKPDLALYDVSFDIGRKLDGDNFKNLPHMIKARIGV